MSTGSTSWSTSNLKTHLCARTRPRPSRSAWPIRRQKIYTDGRTLPAEYNLPAYLGYSVGRWERDTFVVETRGFNDQTVLDALGHAHSDQLAWSSAFAAA